MKIKKSISIDKHGVAVFQIKIKKFIFWHTEFSNYRQDLVDKKYREILRCSNVEEIEK